MNASTKYFAASIFLTLTCIAGGERVSAQTSWTATPLTQISLPIPDQRYGLGWAGEAALLSDSRIAVVVRASDGRDRTVPAAHELRFYDATGHPLKIGAAGTIPIPFAHVQQVAVLPGDNVGVFGDRSRIIVNAAGQVVRNEPIKILMGRRDLPIVSTSDGTLASERVLPNGDVIGYYGDFGKMKQFHLVQQYVMTRGDKAVHLIDIPAAPTRGVGYDGEYFRTLMMPAHASRPMMTVGPDRIYIANSGNPEIYAFSLDGKQLPTIALNRKTTPVTATEAAAYKARYVANAVEIEKDSKDPRRDARLVQMKADLDSVPPSEFKPYFGSMIASATGDLWISDYNTDPDQPIHWTVLDATGHDKARVTLPAHFTPYQVTPDRVIGVFRQGTDQRITVMKLSKK